MRIDRSASFPLALVVGVSWTFAGCGSGGGDTVQVSPDAQKKTQDMLGNMQKKMQDLHKADGKAAKKGH
jgi:hypothetical protein